MFAARGIAVSFSMFFLLYSGLSVVVATLWARVGLTANDIPHVIARPAVRDTDVALGDLPGGDIHLHGAVVYASRAPRYS